MKLLASATVFAALLAVVLANNILPRVLPLSETRDCSDGQDVTICPNGCCPMPNYYCCIGLYCAYDPWACPENQTTTASSRDVQAPVQIKLEDAKTNQCEGTQCPNGCCPQANWFCCDDGEYCAATEADCGTKIALLAKPEPEVKQCDGTQCAGGCCPEPNWVCCPDNIYCADVAGDCP